MNQVKVLPHHFKQLSGALLKGSTQEQACFLLCKEYKGIKKRSLVVQKVFPLDKNDYEIQLEDQLRVKSSTMLNVARAAQEAESSVLMVHTHPMANNYVRFSQADDNGNIESFRFFNRLLPDKYNGCLVFNKDLSGVCGRVYLAENTWESVHKLQVYGAENATKIETYVEEYGTTQPPSPTSIYSRQELLIGSEGQRRLSELNVVIVGAGGIGSIANTLLSHTCNCSITLIDHDVVETSNTPRLIGCNEKHDGEYKTNIAKQYSERANPQCQVTSLALKTEDPKALPYLKDADVIICGTDTASSRAFINRICCQYAIPLLDLGVEFICNSEQTKITSETGRVNLVQPGTPCLECCNLIDREKLAYEECPETERENRANEGYIRGSTAPQPSMMMFNMEVVSRGIQKLLGYFTGLIEDEAHAYETFCFTGSNSTKHHSTTRKRHNSACIYCSPDEASLLK